MAEERPIDIDAVESIEDLKEISKRIGKKKTKYIIYCALSTAILLTTIVLGYGKNDSNFLTDAAIFAGLSVGTYGFAYNGTNAKQESLFKKHVDSKIRRYTKNN